MRNSVSTRGGHLPVDPLGKYAAVRRSKSKRAAEAIGELMPGTKMPTRRASSSSKKPKANSVLRSMSGMPSASSTLKGMRKAKTKMRSSGALPSTSRSKRERLGQIKVVSQKKDAEPLVPFPSIPDHVPFDNQSRDVRNSTDLISPTQSHEIYDVLAMRARASADSISATDRASLELTPATPVSDLVADLRLYSRRRQDALNAEGNITRQMKRVVSRILEKQEVTDKDVLSLADTESVAPFLIARKPLSEWRAREEKIMVQLAKRLPVYESFWKPIKGLGDIGLAHIIGESGDLSLYANPGKLWRRFGLHVHDGKAFSTLRSQGGLSAKEWATAGYSPRRRSVIYTYTESLLRQQGPYKDIYLQRKIFEREKAETAGLTVIEGNKILVTEKDLYRSLKHIHFRAMRYVGKRVLRDLWRAWRGQSAADIHGYSASSPSEGRAAS